MNNSQLSFSLANCFYLLLGVLLLTSPELLFKLDSEDGLIEWVGAISFFITGVVLFLCASETKKTIGFKNLKFGLFIFTSLAFIWAAGEELSWGQHVTGHQTPEWLAKINFQKETNIHNINKSFFDRTIERLTILLTFITVFQHLRKKDSLLGFRLPEYSLNLAFMLIPIYRKFQTFYFGFWNISFIAFLGYPILGIMTKDKKMMRDSVIFIITVSAVAYINHNFIHLFGNKRNFYDEVRETLFSILCVFYSLQLLSDVKKEATHFQ